MVICPNCNIEVIGNFCPKCGANAAQMAAQPAAQPYQQPYQQPYRQPAPAPLPRKATIAMVLAIISVVMLFMAGAFAWWSLSMDAKSEGGTIDFEMEVKVDFTLTEGSYEIVTKYDGSTDTDEDEDDLTDDMKDVGGTTGLLIMLGIVMTIIVIVLVGLLMYSPRNVYMAGYTKIFQNLALIFALLAVIFVLIAPIYYMVAWPDAVEDETSGPVYPVGGDGEFYDGSFMGSDSVEVGGVSASANWGPGLGWILAFVCLILLLITLAFVKQGGDEAVKMVPAVLPMAQPQYGYQQQIPQQPPQQQPQTTYQQATQQQIGTKMCVNCSQILSFDAVICPICGHDQSLPIPPAP